MPSIKGRGNNPLVLGIEGGTCAAALTLCGAGTQRFALASLASFALTGEGLETPGPSQRDKGKKAGSQQQEPEADLWQSAKEKSTLHALTLRELAELKRKSTAPDIASTTDLGPELEEERGAVETRGDIPISSCLILRTM